MKRFRFIGTMEYAGFKFGEAYEYDVECPEEHRHSTKFYIDKYPEDWEKVVEQDQKSPEQYYVGDDKINVVSISGFYNGVVFSLSGDFEQCVKLFNFIGYLEGTKK